MLLQLVFWLTYLVYFCVFFLSAGGARVNVTVDDAEIDNGVSRITYSDPTTWKEGNGCTSCAAHPSTDNVFDKTWHDTSFPTNGTYGDLRNASLVFNGSAIYVYCIISHSLDNPFGNSDMTFYIDDEVVGNYALYPNGDPNYDFNVPVYTNDSISPGVHSFRLQGGSIGGQWSIVLLDYIVYTQDNDESSSAIPPKSSSRASSGRAASSDSSPNSTLSSPSISPSASLAPNNAQSQDLRNTSGPHRRTVIIAVTVSCGIVLAGIVLAGLFLRLRGRRTKESYEHEPNTMEDRVSSFGAGHPSNVGSPSTIQKLQSQRPHTDRGSEEGLIPGSPMNGSRQYPLPIPELGIAPFLNGRAQVQPSTDPAASFVNVPISLVRTASSSSSFVFPPSASTVDSSDTLATSGSRSPLVTPLAVTQQQSSLRRSRKQRELGLQPSSTRSPQDSSATVPASLPMSEIGEDPPPAYEASGAPRDL